ncbi:MAG TPA: hypothetical protein VGQ83_17125 [Polyangia bacterium]
MRSLKARVRGGRLVLDVPTKLPEDTVVDLVVAEDDDDLDDEERAALHAALAEGWASARAGRTRPAEDLLDELRSKRK